MAKDLPHDGRGCGVWRLLFGQVSGYAVQVVGSIDAYLRHRVT